jgi:hypothetical protein
MRIVRGELPSVPFRSLLLRSVERLPLAAAPSRFKNLGYPKPESTGRAGGF